MVQRKQGKKALNVMIPADLHDMYAKLCIDLGITKTEGIVEYFQYLKKTYYKHRQVLDEKSDADFKLDARKSK